MKFVVSNKSLNFRIDRFFVTACTEGLAMIYHVILFII